MRALDVEAGSERASLPVSSSGGGRGARANTVIHPSRKIVPLGAHRFGETRNGGRAQAETTEPRNGADSPGAISRASLEPPERGPRPGRTTCAARGRVWRFDDRVRIFRRKMWKTRNVERVETAREAPPAFSVVPFAFLRFPLSSRWR